METTLRAARQVLAAQLRRTRSVEWERHGRTPRYPHFAENRRAKDDAWLDGFMHAAEGGPQETGNWPVSTEDEMGFGGLAGFWTDGWEAGVKWARRHRSDAFHRMMLYYALEDVPLSRGDEGVFYNGPRLCTWKWEEREDGTEQQIWVGPKNLPKDVGDMALMIAVTRLQYAIPRWQIRTQYGRTDEELLRDIEREFGSVEGGDLPVQDPRWKRDPSLKNPEYGKWLSFYAWGPNAHKMTSVPKGAGLDVYSAWLPYDDKRKYYRRLRGAALVGSARKVFKIGVPEGAVEQSTGQGVLL